MRRTVLVYGLLGGVLIALLKAVEYRYLAVDHSLEIYGGVVAVVFSGLGIWLGLRLVRPRETVVVREVPVEVHVEVPVEVPVPFEVRVATSGGPFVRDAERQQHLGITAREVEILELIAAGLSTREIAGRIHLSENTVKTHSARLFMKLSANRRTQAVHRGREAGLIP